MRKVVGIAFLVFALLLAACQQATPTPTPLPSVPESQATSPAVEPQPMVEVKDQAIVDGAVVVPLVVSPGAGWMVIHADAEGKPGPILGYAPVQAGENRDVKVTVDATKATEVLHAMLHVDAGMVSTFEFPDGPDAPVKVDDKIVMKPFKVLQGNGEGMEGEVVNIQGFAFNPGELRVKVGGHGDLG